MEPQTKTPSAKIDNQPNNFAAEMPLPLARDENIQWVVHRHPYGLFAIYFVSLAGVIASLSLFILVGQPLFNDLTESSKTLTSIIGFVVIATLFFILLAVSFIYRLSRLIITNKNVVQVLQRTLFNRDVSELSMGDVEDVKAEQRGFFASTLNFGTLTVETAGTERNFIFPYCPHPTFYARAILNAREQYLEDASGE